ncbi:MAG: hypothetical protein JW982_01885 [Spirochaetes bacterium]|nr:hypothetical protein [Spirochaetota bacterium]
MNFIKKIIKYSAVILILNSVAQLSAAGTDSIFENAASAITETYVKSNPSKGMKKGIAVLKFEESGELVKQKGLGTTVQSLFSNALINSTVFHLIDRDNLEQRFKEAELSMTGIVDPETLIESGKETGVEYLLTGSISEEGENFLIAASLINTETGAVIARQNFRILQSKLVDKRKQLAYDYISTFGIGVNMQTHYAFIQSPVDNITIMNDIYVSYRPSLNINYKLGITHLFAEFNDSSNVLTSSLYSNYNSANVIAYDPNIKSGYNGGHIDHIAPYLGFEYNRMISEKFAVAMGAGITVLHGLILEQGYSTNPVRTSPYDGSPTDFIIKNSMTIEQKFKTTAMFRLELRPQYFISPRATLGLFLTAFYTPDLRIESTDFGDGYTLYPNESEGDTDPADWRLGFNAEQFGLDSNVQKNLKLTGFSAGISLSFYF